MFPHYAYLVLDLLLLPVWLALFALRKDLRKEILIGGLAFGVIAFLTEPLFIRDYWSPQYVAPLFWGNIPIGSFEDFLYGFFKGGIASAIYEFVFSLRFRKTPDAHYKWAHFIIPFYVVGFAVFLGTNLHWGINSMYASLIASGVCFLFILWYRRDLIVDGFVSGLFLIGVWFGVLLLFQLLYPGIIDSWWHLDNLSGIRLAGVPIEELYEALLVGAIGAPLYAFFTGRHFLKLHPRKLFRAFR